MNNQGLTTKQLLDSAGAGPLGLEKASEMAGKGGDDGLRFSFEYGGFLFAVFATSGEQNTNMRFHANLGSLPYTAENPHDRAHAMAVLRSASKALGGRVQLTPRQRILLQENITINEPLTPAMLMSRAAKLLVMAKPYLELLSEFVHPPLEA